MWIFIKKILNSYLTPRFIFDKVISDIIYDRALVSKKSMNCFSYKLKRRLKKMIFFWPTIIDTDYWIEGGVGKHRDPSHFCDLDVKTDMLLLDEVFNNVSSKNAPILDLGCNNGRHLEYLYNKGLKNLTGVDVMKEALLLFQNRRQEVYSNIKLYHDFFQRFLTKTPDKQFEIVYSVGATIEIVHPSYDIIRQVCRITKKTIILLLHENAHNYPRFYEQEFIRHGFFLTHFVRPIAATPISLLTFRNRI